jgi:hypothetical protein
MLSKLVGSVVLGGALTIAGAAPAVAATGPATGAGCDRAPALEARLQHVDARIATALPRLTAAEDKARSAGHDKVADRIGRRLRRLEKLQDRIGARLAKIEARCPGASGSTGSTGSTGTASGTATGSATA